MTKKKPSAQLKKAKKLIENGWCKGSAHRFWNGTDRYCAVGALETIVKLDPYSQASAETVTLYYQCFDFLTEAVKEYAPIDYPKTIITFNDHQRTKKEDVLAVYDLAIKKAQDEENSNV